MALIPFTQNFLANVRRYARLKKKISPGGRPPCQLKSVSLLFTNPQLLRDWKIAPQETSRPPKLRQIQGEDAKQPNNFIELAANLHDCANDPSLLFEASFDARKYDEHLLSGEILRY